MKFLSLSFVGRIAGGLLTVGLLSTAANAATIVKMVDNNPTIIAGQAFSLDLVMQNAPASGLIGGGTVVSWTTDTLIYDSVNSSISGSGWDSQFSSISPPSITPNTTKIDITNDAVADQTNSFIPVTPTQGNITFATLWFTAPTVATNAATLDFTLLAGKSAPYLDGNGSPIDVIYAPLSIIVQAPAAVPVPPAILLFMSALGGLGFFGRHKRT